MPIFHSSRSNRLPVSANGVTPPELPRAAARPEEDWSDDARIRAEWTSQLQGVEEGRLGWTNGMRLFEQQPVAAQLLNVAEYLTRGLAYTYLGQPLITDEQAAETVRRVLRAISDMPPTVPSFQREFAPRLVRLALAVARQQGSQPVSLGGDGRIGEGLLRADVVIDAISAPGVARADRLRHFFGASGAGPAATTTARPPTAGGFDETVATVEWTLGQAYAGKYRAIEEVLPHRAWALALDETPVLLGVLAEPVLHVRATAGIAAGVPAIGEVALALSEVNAELWNGRAYLARPTRPANPRCAVIQEIFFAEALSREFLPSIQCMVDNINTLARRAAMIRPQFVSEFGARAIGQQEIGLLFD
ncbi:hypothetical protein ACQP2P_15575 [Dactylosporangium sp. CA-139114]|uniref:hypothetical protein n=1 Tax=Dactylosporangium sp. CA-139114 TaxID=3239931 RepID=UPI003D95443A